jgi:hypothetical protein
MFRQTRRLLLLGGLVAVLAGSIGFGGASLAAFSGPSAVPTRLEPPALGKYFFGQQRLSRAELILTIGGVTHDFRVDQGRVRAVTADSLRLKERAEGQIVTIPVSPTAVIRVNGRPATLAQIRPGYVALTIRDGVDAPADAVRAVGIR